MFVVSCFWSHSTRSQSVRLMMNLQKWKNIRCPIILQLSLAVEQKLHSFALKLEFLVKITNVLFVIEEWSDHLSPTMLLIAFLGSVYSVRAVVGFLSDFIFSSLSVIFIFISLLTHSSFPHTPSLLVGAARARSEWLPTAVCQPGCMLHVTPCKIIETRIAPLFYFEFAIASPLSNEMSWWDELEKCCNFIIEFQAVWNTTLLTLYNQNNISHLMSCNVKESQLLCCHQNVFIHYFYANENSLFDISSSLWQSLFPEIKHDKHAGLSEHEMCCGVSCVMYDISQICDEERYG